MDLVENDRFLSESVVFWLGNRDFPAQRAYRAASGLPTAAKTVHRNVFFRYAPALFESLIKRKRIKKGTNPCGLIPFLIGKGAQIRTPLNF